MAIPKRPTVFVTMDNLVVCVPAVNTGVSCLSGLSTVGLHHHLFGIVVRRLGKLCLVLVVTAGAGEDLYACLGAGGFYKGSFYHIVRIGIKGYCLHSAGTAIYAGHSSLSLGRAGGCLHHGGFAKVVGTGVYEGHIAVGAVFTGVGLQTLLGTGGGSVDGNRVAVGTGRRIGQKAHDHTGAKQQCYSNDPVSGLFVPQGIFDPGCHAYLAKGDRAR